MVRTFAGVIIAWVALCGPTFAQSTRPVPQPRPSSAIKAPKKNPQAESWRKNLEAFRKTPLTYFVAKGEPHACGDGCDRWIAAEGSFDPGAADRLRKFLAVPGREGLPIFFHSRGGSLPHALEIGIILRQRGMTAGVARTVPHDCDLSSDAGERHCEELKRFGNEVPSELVYRNAGCHSACVYAMIGGVVRHVAPEARLGVHSPLSIRVGPDGVTTVSQDRIARVNELTKRYIEEMGVDPNLHVIALATPNQRIRNLTRDELVRLKIDPRDLIETRWAVTRSGSSHLIEKSIFEERDHGRREYRPSFLNLSCTRRDEIRIAYGRPLVQSEADVPSTIRFVAGDDAIEFPSKAGNGAPLLDRVRTSTAPAKVLERMAAGKSIEIAEKFLPSGQPSWSRQVKISTAGLLDALAALLNRCR